MGTREQTRELVLEAAESLFLTKGLIEVSMEDIATKASCTRRNLYRYFDTKEALSIAVLRKLLSPWNDFQLQTFQQLRSLSLSGREELISFLKTLAKYLETNKPLLRFTAEFDFVFRERSTFQLDASSEESLFAEFQITEKLITQILERGEVDRSLSIPSSKAIIVPTITTVLWGLGQRVALRETLIPREFGVNGMELVQTQIDLLVLALETKEGPGEKKENLHV